MSDAVQEALAVREPCRREPCPRAASFFPLLHRAPGQHESSDAGAKKIQRYAYRTQRGDLHANLGACPTATLGSVREALGSGISLPTSLPQTAQFFGARLLLS